MKQFSNPLQNIFQQKKGFYPNNKLNLQSSKKNKNFPSLEHRNKKNNNQIELYFNNETPTKKIVNHSLILSSPGVKLLQQYKNLKQSPQLSQSMNDTLLCFPAKKIRNKHNSIGRIVQDKYSYTHDCPELSDNKLSEHLSIRMIYQKFRKRLIPQAPKQVQGPTLKIRVPYTEQSQQYEPIILDSLKHYQEEIQISLKKDLQDSKKPSILKKMQRSNATKSNSKKERRFLGKISRLSPWNSFYEDKGSI